MQISLTKKDYISLKAMFNATGGGPYNRTALMYVHYNHEKQEFVAADGHIMVIKPLALFSTIFPDLNPEKSFLLEKSQFGLMSSAIQPSGNIITINETLREENEYPEYYKAIPGPDRIKAISEIGLDFELVERFLRCFPGCKCNNFDLTFTGPIGAILITYCPITKEQFFVGIIMPRAIEKIEEETHD